MIDFHEYSNKFVVLQSLQFALERHVLKYIRGNTVPEGFVYSYDWCTDGSHRNILVLDDKNHMQSIQDVDEVLTNKLKHWDFQLYNLLKEMNVLLAGLYSTFMGSHVENKLTGRSAIILNIYNTGFGLEIVLLTTSKGNISYNYNQFIKEWKLK